MTYRKPTKVGDKVRVKGGFCAERKTGPQVRGKVPRYTASKNHLFGAMLLGQAKRKERTRAEEEKA